jgi:hypothetical protein
VIEIKKSHKGELHRAMGIPAGKKIPLSMLMKKKASAEKEGDTANVKRATFAINARGFKH